MKLIIAFGKKLLIQLRFPVFFVITLSTLMSFCPGALIRLAWLFISFFVIVIWACITLSELIIAVFRTQKGPLALKTMALILLVPIVKFGLASGDYIHLFVLYPHYLNVVAEYGNGQAVPVKIDWGDAAMTALDGMKQRTLIYDQSHVTEKLVGRSWTDSEGFTYSVTHLIGHFYLERTSS